MKPERILSLVLLLSLAITTGLSPFPPTDTAESSPDAPDLLSPLNEAPVGSELVERRTAYSATHKTDIGYRAVISDAPLHYLDADNQSRLPHRSARPRGGSRPSPDRQLRGRAQPDPGPGRGGRDSQVRRTRVHGRTPHRDIRHLTRIPAQATIQSSDSRL